MPSDFSSNPSTPLRCAAVHLRGVLGLRIGKIKYLNCLPYYSGLEAGESLQFESGTPAEINRMMREGKIDIAPISSMEYLQHPEDYLLFPDLGIASRDYVRSVTLFSKKKIEDLNGADIAVTEESLTSVHLLDLILRDKYKVQAMLDPMPSNPKAMLEKHDAALLIGNDALLVQPRKWIYRYDLGNLWYDWQKLPFVYAVWAVRREAVTSNAAAVQDFYHALKERFLYNIEHLSECIQKHCSIGEFDKLDPKIRGYLSGLVYQFDNSCWQGFKKFSELAEARGFCGEAEWQTISLGSESLAHPPISSPG